MGGVKIKGVARGETMCIGVSTVNWTSAGTASKRGGTVTARFHVIPRASPLPSLYLFHMTPMLGKVADQ